MSDAIGDLPETVLQFGGGNFLRAFADLFIDQANRAGQAVGRIVVVQSTPSGVADRINQQRGEYHVITRGVQHGKRVDDIETVRSVSRALDARSQWNDVLAVGKSPALRYIISNTTEAGLSLDSADTVRPVAGVPPMSFPAKLLDVLWSRFESGEQHGLVILPCELIPKNGGRLRDLVLEQATRWCAPGGLIPWLHDNNHWMNSLVDRIVSGKPADHELVATDALLTVTEPFSIWAIEAQDGVKFFSHPSIHMVDDTTPIELRKIRILNGAHTALVAKALPINIATVREAVEHPVVGPWLKRLLMEEIVPTIDDRVPDASGFAAATLERFLNPFLEHKLSAIALNHEAKVKTRLIPTRDEFAARFGHPPKLLSELLST